MKTLQVKKYVLYLILWAFVATILLISNTIGNAIGSGSTHFVPTAFYHFIASSIWIPVAIFFTHFYSDPKHTSIKWLFISFSFYPLLIIADTLFRSFIRYILLDVPISIDTILSVLLTLIDTNFLIFGCLSLFIYSSINMMKDETHALQRARMFKTINEEELERVSSMLPPGFLARNIDRIIEKYDESYERGEDMIVKFSDFLRLIIYKNNAPQKNNDVQKYIQDLKKTYEIYISTYLESEVHVMAEGIDELYHFDSKIALNNEELVN